METKSIIKLISVALLFFCSCLGRVIDEKLILISERQYTENRDQLKNLEILYNLNQQAKNESNIEYVHATIFFLQAIKKIHEDIGILLDQIKKDSLSEDRKRVIDQLIYRLKTDFKSERDYQSYSKTVTSNGTLAIELTNLEREFLVSRKGFYRKFQ